MHIHRGEGYMKVEAEAGEMQPQAKECWQPPVLEELPWSFQKELTLPAPGVWPHQAPFRLPSSGFGIIAYSSPREPMP